MALFWGKDQTVIGFAEFEHHEFQGCGVGSTLINEIATEATHKALSRIYAEVSITARPLFERKGFTVVKQQTVTIRGAELTNFVMERNFFNPVIRP